MSFTVQDSWVGSRLANLTKAIRLMHPAQICEPPAPLGQKTATAKKRLPDYLRTATVTPFYTLSRERLSRRNAVMAPTEQPPRKLSGTRTAQREHLESGA